MTIDVRAVTVCNLGPLLSASISDDYVQGAGLIKTTGTCQIASVISPTIGARVTFQYTKNNITRTVPRYLRVMSSFADPYRKVTTVQFGCPLSYMEDVREPINWSALQDPENADFTQEDQSIVVVPIHASSIAKECLAKIGLSGSVPLTNVFSISRFDFSSGYVSILNDLLLSEGFCGYIGIDGSFKYFSLETVSNPVRVINEQEIIDVSPIGFGKIPAEAVTVSYNSLKLKQPEPSESEEEIQKRSWEYEESYGAVTEIFLSGNYTPRPISGYTSSEEWESSYTYTPRMVTRTNYDKWDRVTSRITIESTIAAEANPDYIKQLISYSRSLSIGSTPIYKVTATNIRYKKNPTSSSDNQDPEEGYDEVLEEVTTVYEPQVVRVGSISGNYYDSATDSFVFLSLSLGPSITPSNPGIINESNLSSARSQITTTSYSTNSRDVSILNTNGVSRLGYFPITKTTVNTRKLFGQTARGQQFIAAKTEDGYSIEIILQIADQLVDAGTTIRNYSGREAVLQARASSADRVISALADGGDPNNGYSVSGSSDIELVAGSSSATRRIELSMPYAPDDTFQKSGTGESAVFTAKTSDASAKAAKFGRIQNSLILGNRYGINLTIAPEIIPNKPFGAIAMQANGLTNIYATNGTSWAIDPNGIIVATDALLLGVYSKA